MEPECSLPHSQQPATSPYPETDRSSPCPHPTSRKSILILSSHVSLGIPSDLHPSGFPTKTLYASPSSSLAQKSDCILERLNYTTVPCSALAFKIFCPIICRFCCVLSNYLTNGLVSFLYLLHLQKCPEKVHSL